VCPLLLLRYRIWFSSLNWPENSEKKKKKKKKEKVMKEMMDSV
jgi:hypothetical protein